MNKKGISPVIATLLLIIIAVAAAILTYLWVTGYIGTLQQQGGTEGLHERIRIEAVGYNSSTGTLTIYVRNIGDVSTTIDAAYIIDHTNTVVKSNTTLSGEPLDLDAGDLTTVQIDGSLTLSDGETYIVRVVTTTGVEADYTFTYRE